MGPSSPDGPRPSDPPCRVCVLPQHRPHITFDETGTCNHCRRHAASGTKGAAVRLLETDLVRRIRRHRGRGEYDCIVHCNGGLDTITALYLACKRFRVRPLVLTIDNGFENPTALANVERATDALGVDRIVHHDTSLAPLFEQMVRTDSHASICAVCTLWTTQLLYRFAEQYRLTLVLNGLTAGHLARPADEGVEFGSITAATRRFLEQTTRQEPRYRDLPRSTKQLRDRHRRIEVFSVHWFLPQEPEDNRAVVERELGWKSLGGGYPAGSIKSHCRLDPCNSERDLRHHGFTYHHVEASRLIRLGLWSRKEALAAFAGEPDPDQIAEVLADLQRVARQS